MPQFRGYKGLSKLQLAKIGEQAGLRGTRLKLYVGFMKGRLPRESDPHYSGEWAERFMKGSQWNMGDLQSRKVMLKVAKRLKYPVNLVKIDYGKTSSTYHPSWQIGEKILYVNERTGKLYRR